MISFCDFVPQILKRGPLGGIIETETFTNVHERANQWLATYAVDVINVETLIFQSQMSGDINTGWGTYRGEYDIGLTYQCLRVWYRST